MSDTLASARIVLIGCGNMGRAMLEGWLSLDDMPDITVYDPGMTKETIQALSQKSVKAGNKEDILNNTADIVVMAVKPQIMDKACETARPCIGRHTTILSIAAGKAIKSFEDIFGAAQPVIRTMPNTPAAVGHGAIVGVCNKNVTREHKQIAENLLQPLGLFEWVDKEELLNAVTAISGSGPAYIFLMMEALKDAGVSLGLTESLAQKLALQTVKGAALLAEEGPGIKFETLRQNVTSPGGTTERALETLMHNDVLKDLIKKAATAACRRSEDLSG